MTAPSISDLPYPDPLADEGDWCALYSPASLRLTLEDIAKECALPDKLIFEEFPPPTDPLSSLDTATTGCKLSLSPSKPVVNVDLEILSQKCQQLETLLAVYQDRISWLSSGSRLHFGHLSGSRVALLVEASDRLCTDADTVMELGCALKALLSEQLLEKEALHLVKFGSEVSRSTSQTLPLTTEKEKSSQLAFDWVSSLKASGTCNLLGALKMVLRLKNVDTICIVLTTRPDQRASVVLDYAVDRLSGRSSPRLHLVAFNSKEDTASLLKQLADQTGGHYHRFFLPSNEDQKHEPLEDTDIDRIQEEIERVRKTLSLLDDLKSGNLVKSLIQRLQEISVSIAWPAEDSATSLTSSSFTNEVTPCDSRQWLCQHGLAARGLNLYRVLAPNAYHQLKGHIPVIDKTVVSEVYEVMPLFPWHDGSFKYLHVDVPMLEQYQEKLKKFLGVELQSRLQWLLSGSRVPFGVITEERVVVAVDCSYPLQAGLLPLQCHLSTLLTEQLPQTRAFSFLRLGSGCSLWTRGMTEPGGQSLAEARKWVLGLSPAGSCDLLSGLRCVFEGDTVLQNQREGEITGVYLIVCTMPDQDVGHLCGYLEQQASGGKVKIHVVFYDIHSLMGSHVIPGRDGGRYGGQEEVGEGLKRIAEAGGGRYHHFELTDEAGASVEGDDITAILEEAVEAQSYLQKASSILESYREFCKRHMNLSKEDPSSPQATVATSPPVHPRQNTASLARLNACSQRLSRSASAVELGGRKARVAAKKRIKTEMFYLDQGIRKGVAWDVLEVSPLSNSKHKQKPLIPLKEEYTSSKAWLSKYGLEMLGLRFECLTVDSSCQSNHKAVFKHINHRGDIVELCVSHQGLKGYVHRLQTAMDRYRSRLEWLLEDFHACFGIVTEKKVLFLLDISNSMTSHIQELKDSLTRLLKHTPPKMKSFNIVTYASTATQWREQLSSVSEEHCLEAAQWLQSVKAGGCSCLLEALKVCLQSEATGIYLVTDGTADHTHEFLLNQIPILRRSFGDSWRINTVAFHSSSEKSHCFLKMLANTCSGRYHSYPVNAVDVKGKVNLELLAESETTSEDLRLMAQEILLSQNDLEQARSLL